jgi:hypothetical protein
MRNRKPKQTLGFYLSPAWRTVRRAALIRDGYRCTVCGCSVAGKGMARVDHIKPIRTYPHLALSLANLRSLCPNHDNKRHFEKGRSKGAGCDVNGVPFDPGHHWQKETQPRAQPFAISRISNGTVPKAGCSARFAVWPLPRSIDNPGHLT